MAKHFNVVIEAIWITNKLSCPGANTLGQEWEIEDPTNEKLNIVLVSTEWEDKHLQI
jgi:hypothetical protein